MVNLSYNEQKVKKKIDYFLFKYPPNILLKKDF